MQNTTKPEDQRRPLNKHISAEDLKKIRGGIADGGELGDTAMRVEKSDEDFPKPS